jgi:methionyl-tRNA formyltransferase
MRDLRIIFMGTPEFAVGVLKKMVADKSNIVAVITSPDKPAGRGRKLRESAVKEYSRSQNIPILQPTNLKDEQFLDQLKSYNANLQVVVAFRMLPKLVWEMPEYGTFNLHASLLPQYRGAAPINWAIINREQKTGVSTFLIDDKIDTGAILLTKEVALAERETVQSLHDKLMLLGGSLVLETISLFKTNKVNPILQTQNNSLKIAPKLTKENTKINWSQSAIALDAFIRGLNPFPSAWSFLFNEGKELTVKIFNGNFILEEHTLNIGTIISTKNELKVALKDGYLIIEEIQIPGKRKMDVKSLLNVYTFSENSKMM